jgi:Polysaccharide lyase
VIRLAPLAIAMLVGLQIPQAISTVKADWETGDNSQYGELECAHPSTQFAVVTSPVRQGRYAARFSEKADDVWLNGQVRCLDPLYNTSESSGDDYYYGFSVYFPKAISDNLIWELHAPYSLYSVSEICSIAPFAVHVRNGSLDFRIATGNCDGRWTHWEPNIVIPGLRKVPVQTWIDFAIRIKFTESGTGVVQLYTRVGNRRWPARPQVSRAGIPTMPYSNGAGVHDVKLYMLVGLYPGYAGYSGEDTIHFDHVVRGSRLSQVAIGANRR